MHSARVIRAALLPTLLLVGCAAPPAERIEAQNHHFHDRARTAARPLDEKAKYFESRLPLKDDLIEPFPVFDNTCQYLAAMAAKRERQPSATLDAQIGRSIRAISRLPDAHIGTNEYAQLFFAYSLMQDHPGVKWHARVLNERFFKEYDYSLPAEFSELRASPHQFSRSRVLDLLVIAEGLKKLTNSPESRQLLEDCIEAGYLRKLRFFQINIGIARIPTDSTDWLNMMRLTTLYQFHPLPEYRRGLERHFKTQRKEDNALFEAMHQRVTGEPSRALELLKHYPLNADNREVYHRPTRYTWIKNKWHARTSEPIRIDQRGYHYNIWKRDPFKAWENPGLEPTIAYHGLDFLLAYHLANLPRAPAD